MEYPPKAWGGCEIVAHALASRCEAAGHEVTVFNTTDLRSVINTINTTNFDFIHVSYDDYIGILSQHCNKKIWGTTHYAGITQWKTYNPGYGPIHEGVLRATGGIISLSEGIAEVYRKDGFQKPIYVLRNGADVGKIRFNSTPVNNKAIYVGKIEPRKKQARLASLCKNKVHIDFVGPMHDPSFKENDTCRYLGEWTREELFNSLTDLAITDVCEANIGNFNGLYLDWNRSHTIPDTINACIQIGQNPFYRFTHREWA